MLEWLKAKCRFDGSILYRGTMPPRAQEFAALKDRGFQLREIRSPGRWGLELRHAELGTASLHCPEETGPIRQAVQWSTTITEGERDTLSAAGSEVRVQMTLDRGDLLSERKRALRVSSEIMGDDALAVIDLAAWHIWSRAALADELSHDADLDISQILGGHLVGAGGSEDAAQADGDDEDHRPPPDWMHTHGLGEIGFFDFDILRPSRLVVQTADLQRAIAFAIVEGLVSPSTPRAHIAQPGGVVRFVEAATFDRLADREWVALRGNGDPDHRERRAVLCEPAGRFFGRWSRSVKPSRFMQTADDDGLLLNFSSAATQLMSDRALKSYPYLRAIAEEFAEFEFPVLVKLGYRVDGGDENDREHLWFKVDSLSDDSVEGELVNRPVSIAAMHEGDRGTHSVEGLSGWALVTPVGMISPFWSRPLRELRERKDVLREMMKAIREGKADT